MPPLPLISLFLTILSTVHESDGWHKFGCILYPICAGTECWHDSKSCTDPGWLVSITFANRSKVHKLTLNYSINMSLMIGAAFPSFRLDQMGRRKTLMIGTCLVGGSMMFITILLSIGNKAASTACIAFFFTVGQYPLMLLSNANERLLSI